MPALTDEATLFIEEIAGTDPYRLFGPSDVFVCRFCLRPKTDRSHGPTCEHERAQHIRSLSDETSYFDSDDSDE